MEKTITIQGIASGISTFYTQAKCCHAFTLTAGDKSYKVYVRDNDCEWDLNDGDHYTVSGIVITYEMVVATSVDRWGRICDVCGKWHTEGYYVGEDEYACSDECAIKLYGGNETAFREDLALLDDEETADDAVTYWTEWE